MLGGAVTLSPTTASPALAGTGGYPYYNAPCEFGVNGGSSCENPDQTDYPGDAYDWYENGGNAFSGSLCWYGTNSECFDPWGYQYRNCTSFVAWKLTSQGVAASKVKGLGNGGDWYSNAPASEQSLTPQAGDAAVQTPTGSNPYGHVAYVDSVSGSNVTIEEYNYAGTGAWDTRTGTPSALGFSEVTANGRNSQSTGGGNARWWRTRFRRGRQRPQGSPDAGNGKPARGKQPGWTYFIPALGGLGVLITLIYVSQVAGGKRWSVGAVVHVRYTAVCSFEGKGGHRGRKHIVPD